MSAVTYSDKSLASEPTQVAQAKKGFFRRLLDAVIAARMEQADRELALFVQRTGRYPIQ